MHIVLIYRLNAYINIFNKDPLKIEHIRVLIYSENVSNVSLFVTFISRFVTFVCENMSYRSCDPDQRYPDQTVS